ncbi:MAG: hypothetical protein ABH803_02885 [Candidatus Micrarchaeota archaeon]
MLLTEKPITNAEALDLLKKRKKEGELGYEQQLTFEYLEKNVSLSLKEANALQKALSGLSLFEDRVVVQLVNVLPTKEDDLRLFLASYSVELTDEDVKKTMSILKEHEK